MNTELLKLSKKELNKYFKNMNSRETAAVYNELEYLEKISEKGKLVWNILMRKSGMVIYKGTNRHLI